MVRRRLLLLSLALSVGLALACLWILDRGLSVVEAAPERRRARLPGDVITVCLGGGCDHGSIQAAVDAASGGELIKVAGGVYDDLQRRDGITQVVYISKSVAVRGGYTTTDGFADPPDPAAHPTTLDARGLGRGVTISGATGVELVGFRVTGGRAGGLPQDYGGGLLAVNAAVVVSDCRVYSNTAQYGGGIQLRYSPNSALLNNDVYSNSADFSAGVYLRHSPTATLAGNTIYRNEADWGGGVYLSRSGGVTLTENHICSNTAVSGGGGAFINLSDGVRWMNNRVYSNTAGADENGGGIRFRESSGTWLTGNDITRNVAGYGSGVYIDSSSHQATLTDNRIYRNAAINYGSGGGVHIGGDNATLSGNAVFDNDGDDRGGGVHISGGDSVTLDGNDIYSNTTSNWGGGLCLENVSTATLTHNRIFDNVAERGGGIGLDNAQNVALQGTRIQGNLSATDGGGLYLDGSDVTMTNTMLTDNFANFDGAGVYVTSGTARLLHATLARNRGHQGVTLEGAATWLFNSILVSHTVGIGASGASTATLDTTLWGAGEWANVTDTVEVAGGVVITTGDLRGDPAFAAPAVGDYHITQTSAAFDAGVDAGVAIDIDGDPRPLMGGYDVGADEVLGCLARLNGGPVYPTVQAAIDASTDPADLIQVAGTCTEHDVIIDRTLTLQGGWSADFARHDPGAFTTTLDAQGQGRVMEIVAGSPLVADLRIINGSLADGNDGAGVYVGPAAAPVLRNNHLAFNGTGSQGHGGGVCVDDSGAVTLEGNQITSNASGRSGGGVYVESDDARLVGNAISGNTTTNVSDGGGIAIGTYSAATLERNTITGNAADRNGGGLSVGDRTAVTLTNNVIARNTCCDASGWVGGAGTWLGSGDHVLIHNTFSDNGGGDGAGIRLYGDAVLTNTIIANQTVGLVAASAGAAATLEGTLWHGNDRDADGPGTVVTGTVDLHGDPAFVYPGADDYHLTEGSPAVDAGVDSGVGDDLDGDTRPRGLTYDVGADETLDPVVPPAGVSISGPVTGLVETTYTFSATVDPATTTLPSYAWSPEPQSGQGTAQAAYRWSTSGAKPLTVIVGNRAGTAQAQTTVTIQDGTVSVFLPLVLRRP
jgi:hypothetical protein